MTDTQTLQQTANQPGVEIQTLMAFLDAAGRIIQDAERIKT